MKAFDILKGMNDIEDAYIAEADRLLRARPAKRRPSIRARLALIAAAALLFAVGLTLALNADLREAAQAALRGGARTEVAVSQRENIAAPTGEGLLIERPLTTTGNPLRVTVPNYGHASNGFFFVCSDDIEYKSGSHYDVYALDGSALRKLERRYMRRNYKVCKDEYDLDVEWAVDGERCTISYMAESKRGAFYRLIPIDPAQFDFLSEGDNVCMALLSYGITGGMRLMLLDLDSGELTEVISSLQASTATVAVDGMGFILACALTRDGKGLLFRNTDSAYVYCDLVTGEMTALSDLCGAQITGASLVEDSIICYAQIGGEPNEEQHAQYVLHMGTDEPYNAPIDYGSVRVWRVALADFSVTPVDEYRLNALSNPYASWHGSEISEDIGEGLLFYLEPFIGRYLAVLGDGRALYTIDCVTGERRRVQSFTLPEGEWPYIQVRISPDYTRLLISRWSDALNAHELWVIDLAGATASQIDRSAETDGNESYIDWFDATHVLTGGEIGNSGGEMWYYLYDVAQH